MHLRDRPVWSALTTRQAALALGDGLAVRLAPEYGLFAAAADASAEALAALAALVPADGGIALVEAGVPPPVPGTVAAAPVALSQMVAEALTPRPAAAVGITPLPQAAPPGLLPLATLTKR